MELVSASPNPSLDLFSQFAVERVLFLREIEAEPATKLVAQLLWLDKQNPTKEITLYINSVGGSISDGLFPIYDALQYIQAPVKTICVGEAYSSAAVLLASGTKGRRFAFPNAKMMIHGVQIEGGGLIGSSKEIEEECKKTQELNKTMMQILAKHTKQTVAKLNKICEKDYYFNPTIAMKMGFIDQILEPRK